MDLSKLITGFISFHRDLSKSVFMDFSKLLHEFVKVVLGISRSLPNKTKISSLVEASAL